MKITRQKQQSRQPFTGQFTPLPTPKLCKECNLQKPPDTFIKNRKVCRECWARRQRQMPKIVPTQGIWYHPENPLTHVDRQTGQFGPYYLANFARVHRKNWPTHIDFLANGLTVGDVSEWLSRPENSAIVPLVHLRKHCADCGQTYPHYFGHSGPQFRAEAIQAAHNSGQNKGLFFPLYFNRDYTSLMGTATVCIFCQHSKTSPKFPSRNIHPQAILKFRNFQISMSDPDNITCFSKELTDFIQRCTHFDFPHTKLKYL